MSTQTQPRPITHKQILAALPKCLEALELLEKGMTVRQIALLQGVSTQGVRWRLRRAQWWRDHQGTA